MIQLSFERRSSESVESTINLQASGHRVMDTYIPQSSSNEKVTDSFYLFLSGSSASDLVDKVRKIESMLEFARKHPSGPEGVWVLYSPDTGTAWQSRVSDGALLMDERMGKLWKADKTRAQVVFERWNYWETEEAVTLKLSNGSVTEQNVAPLDNCQDASHDLYVEIDADQVTGVLPTPAIIEFTSTKNDANLMDHLAVGLFAADGVNTPPTPGSLVCEGSGDADASCSGGEYDVLSWVTDDEHWLFSWTVASGAFQQKRYRAIARLRDAVAYTDLFLKVKLLAGVVVIAETQWSLVTAGKKLAIIGSVNIPPYALGQSVDLGNLSVALYEKHATGTGNIKLDYIILMPQDGWRRYSAISGLAYNETLIDDPVRGVLVTQYGSSYHKITSRIEEGEPVMLQPGVKNILYFLQDITTGEAEIDRTASVTVKCHPRRLTV